MHSHYKSLYEVALQQYKFQGEQKFAYDDLMVEIYELLDNIEKPELIKRYIENGREKLTLNELKKKL